MLCATGHVPVAPGIPGSKNQVWGKGKDRGEFHPCGDIYQDGGMGVTAKENTANLGTQDTGDWRCS